MRNILLLLALAGFAPASHADAVLSSRTARATAGGELQLDLTITNDGVGTTVIDVPSPVHLRFEDAEHVAMIEFRPDRSGSFEVQPQSFVRVRLIGALPREAEGQAVLKPAGRSEERRVGEG
jgi:hypothetical protein